MDQRERARPSLQDLYQRYGGHVFARCLALLGSEDDAWDAVQEVFMKAGAALAEFEGRSSDWTWLRRISTNHCLNVLRSRKVRRGQGVVDALDPVSGLDAAAGSAGSPGGTARPGVGTVLGNARGVDAEEAAVVRSLLALADPETQALVVGYFLDELSQEEVAEAAGLSVPTVRKRLRRFIHRARKALGGER